MPSWGLLPVVNRLAVAGEVNFMALAKAETVGVLIKCFDRICNNPVANPSFFRRQGCNARARAFCRNGCTKLLPTSNGFCRSGTVTNGSIQKQLLHRGNTDECGSTVSRSSRGCGHYPDRRGHLQGHVPAIGDRSTRTASGASRPSVSTGSSRSPRSSRPPSTTTMSISNGSPTAL